MREKWKTLFLSAWSPAEKGLLLVDVLLFGILLGWLTSPLKGGFTFFSNNTVDNSCDGHNADGSEDDGAEGE